MNNHIYNHIHSHSMFHGIITHIPFITTVHHQAIETARSACRRDRVPVPLGDHQTLLAGEKFEEFDG